ncbi:MAG: RNA polymerase sigma factor [Muribaculaceae bacterium]
MSWLGFRKKSYTDAEVVIGYQSGDKRVMQWWYTRCVEAFRRGTAGYGGISYDEREDLLQDSFVLLWEKFESGQVYVDAAGAVKAHGRTGIVDVTDLTAYFMRIVKNKYLEMLRDGRHVIPMNEQITADETEVLMELYFDNDVEVEKDRIVSQCLLSLPKSCVEILTLFYYERKTLDEILALRPENSSYDGLKSRKAKCMANLKERITQTFKKVGLR